MERIIIGKTGLEINRFGFGGIPIQRVDEDQAVETVLHAIEKGVDFIDTSRVYTSSERKIGLALQRTRSRVVVASKSAARTADGVQADLEISLKELQRDYIDIYQIHGVRDKEEYELIIGKQGSLDGLMKLKEQGLVHHIGITSHSLDLLDHVLDDGFFETIMVCYSFLEPAAKEKIIPKAIEKKVGIIAMKSLSGGVIDNPRLALKYALSQPGVIIIPGVETPQLFDDNWAIYEGSWELDDAERKEIERITRQHDKTFCRRCDYCQPCSEYIPIQYILSIRSIVRRSGKSALSEDWLKAFIDLARNCSECGDCLPRCPYELPIPDLIKENLEWVDEQLE
jgi:predicted aldo/keto reductase-like oxidoreductase